MSSCYSLYYGRRVGGGINRFWLFFVFFVFCRKCFVMFSVLCIFFCFDVIMFILNVIGKGN